MNKTQQVDALKMAEEVERAVISSHRNDPEVEWKGLNQTFWLTSLILITDEKAYTQNFCIFVREPE